MQVSLPVLLGVLFIALKLTGYIAWSWVWVLAPFWLGFAIILFIIVFMGGLAAWIGK